MINEIHCDDFLNLSLGKTKQNFSLFSIFRIGQQQDWKHFWGRATWNMFLQNVIINVIFVKCFLFPFVSFTLYVIKLIYPITRIKHENQYMTLRTWINVNSIMFYFTLFCLILQTSLFNHNIHLVVSYGPPDFNTHFRNVIIQLLNWLCLLFYARYQSSTQNIYLINSLVKKRKKRCLIIQLFKQS